MDWSRIQEKVKSKVQYLVELRPDTVIVVGGGAGGAQQLVRVESATAAALALLQITIE